MSGNSNAGDTVSVYVNGVYNSKFVIMGLNGSWSGTAQLSGQGDSV